MNETILKGLRELITMVEALDVNLEDQHDQELVVLNVRSWYWNKLNAAAKKSKIADIARQTSPLEKLYISEFVFLRRQINPFVRFEIATERNVVCERIITGTKVIPAAAALTLPATPEQTVDVVEWRCSPLLDSNAIATEVQP